MTRSEFYYALLICRAEQESGDPIPPYKLEEFAALATAMADAYSSEGRKRDTDLINILIGKGKGTMKLNIKKMYQDTIHTLEKHQLEISIAIAALSIIAAPAFAKDTQAQEEENDVKNELSAHLHKVLEVIEKELDAVNSKMYESV